MPVKALQRYLKDTINNKTYQLTVRPHLGGWLAIVIVDDMRWEQQTEANAPVETAKEWAIKKALIDAHRFPIRTGLPSRSRPERTLD
jgi:hypothetical protein